MPPSSSKYATIKFINQCIHILNNKYKLNAIEGSTKIQKRGSIFKYPSCFHNVQKNNDDNHKSMKMRLINKLIPKLNCVNIK